MLVGRADEVAVPVAAPAPTGSAVTTVDPRQLVTEQEASMLAGTALGPGKHDDVPGGERG